jgi:hypothetical protein
MYRFATDACTWIDGGDGMLKLFFENLRRDELLKQPLVRDAPIPLYGVSELDRAIHEHRLRVQALAQQHGAAAEERSRRAVPMLRAASAMTPGLFIVDFQKTETIHGPFRSARVKSPSDANYFTGCGQMPGQSGGFKVDIGSGLDAMYGCGGRRCLFLILRDELLGRVKSILATPEEAFSDTRSPQCIPDLSIEDDDDAKDIVGRMIQHETLEPSRPAESPAQYRKASRLVSTLSLAPGLERVTDTLGIGGGVFRAQVDLPSPETPSLDGMAYGVLFLGPAMAS